MAHAVAVNPFLVAVVGYAGLVLAGVLIAAVILLLGKSKLWLPLVLDYVVVPDSALSPQEVAFLEARGQELAALGFHPVFTYRLIDAPRPLLSRVWFDATATIVCIAQRMTTSPRREARFLSMCSYGAEDAALTTGNLPSVPVFAEMPKQKTREVVEARTAEALLSAHRAAMEEAGLVAVPQVEASLPDEISRRHRSFGEFQERHGVLRRDEKCRRWVGTLRAHVRLVFGQLLPSAPDFEPARLIRAVVAGAVVPAACVLWAYSRGGAWILLAQPAIFASGFAASVFFTARAWPWALILGALPLLSGRWLGPEPALALFLGALSGNVITLRRNGLIASPPGAKRRVMVTIIIWSALVMLFFGFYSYFSRQKAQRRHVDRPTTKTPLR
jgi:hypothetical protein